MRGAHVFGTQLRASSGSFAIIFSAPKTSLAARTAVKEIGVLTGKRIERSEIGAPREFDSLTDVELKRAVIERFIRLGFAPELAISEGRWLCVAFQPLRRAPAEKLTVHRRAPCPLRAAMAKTQLITKIGANDREIDFVNADGLPMGVDRLRSAELVAREV